MFQSFDEALAVAERFPEVTCSIGTHPHYATESVTSPCRIVEQTRNPRVVAIGEVGLDASTRRAAATIRKQLSHSNIAAARETALPVVIHTRDADEDAARILRDEYGAALQGGLLHRDTGGRSWRRPPL